MTTNSVQKLKFIKNKYDRDLLVDCHAYTEADIVDLRSHFTTNYYEIHILQCSKVELNFDDRLYKISGYNILFLSYQNVRRWGGIGKRIKGKILLFEKEFFEGFLKGSMFLYSLPIFHYNKDKPYLKLSFNEFCDYLKLFDELENSINNYKPDRKELIVATLYYLILKLNYHYIKEYNLPEHHKKPHQICLKFLELIDNHPNITYTVEKIANELEISKTHLNKILKKHFNAPASALIRSRVIQEAKRKLVLHKENITQISYKLGFSEVSNFSRYFKAYTGSSPSEYISMFPK